MESGIRTTPCYSVLSASDSTLQTFLVKSPALGVSQVCIWLCHLSVIDTDTLTWVSALLELGQVCDTKGLAGIKKVQPRAWPGSKAVSEPGFPAVR